MRLRFLDEEYLLSADQGLRRLIEGIKDSQQARRVFPPFCKETLAALAKGQQPYATRPHNGALLCLTSSSTPYRNSHSTYASAHSQQIPSL